MARLSQKSSTLFQTISVAVMSAVTQSPPPTPPAYTFLYPLAASSGSHSVARVLPPILFGPRSCQLIFAIGFLVDFSLIFRFIYARETCRASIGISPVAGSWVISHSCLNRSEIRCSLEIFTLLSLSLS